MDCKVYVGGLPADATSEELEDQFRRFGRIRKIWVARRPPGFAFVEYEDGRDAEDAARTLDGQRICGVRARVEMSHGRGRSGGGGGGGGSRGGGYGGGYSGDRGGGRGRSRSRSPKRGRSRSRSPRRSRSRSPRYDDKKRSPSRERSRSRSKSRSRSRSASRD